MDKVPCLMVHNCVESTRTNASRHNYATSQHINMNRHKWIRAKTDAAETTQNNANCNARIGRSEQTHTNLPSNIAIAVETKHNCASALGIRICSIDKELRRLPVSTQIRPNKQKWRRFHTNTYESIPVSAKQHIRKRIKLMHVQKKKWCRINTMRNQSKANTLLPTSYT